MTPSAKAISANPPPHLLALVLFICGIYGTTIRADDYAYEMSPYCSTDPPPPKKKSHLSLIETHCFLMVGNRDKGEGGHTWAQCRHVGIHQLTSTECPHICRRFERKRRQEARSPPTISERHLQQSLYSNRPGAVPQPNQWHLSAL